ncbi:Conserved_hypothetical protein [Hexamita inflata]|uniref:Uncharacterized protein n=1 Tax=Hexamita inflata TaxID=28002 RepID=A0AA86U302_9EUKA|nr:Conserved hypothetical protein [Hexamita inflata]
MEEIQFPRIELLRAEATLLYLDKISNQLIAEFQQKAIEITKNMKDFVMTHKWLGKMCTFEELEMSYSGTCDEKSLIHNYINLNFCHEFKNQIFEHCLIAFEKLIKKYQKMQLISSQIAKQYDTQYLVYENEEYVDRLSSFGIMCVFACIQDENNFYDSKVFLKAKGNGIELPRTPKGISIKNTNNYIKSEEQSHRTSEAQIDDLSLEQDLYIAPKQTVDSQKTETLKLRKYPDNKNPDNNSSQSIQKTQTEKEDTLKYFKPVVERTAQQQDQIVNKSLIQMLGTKVEEIHEIRRSDSKSFASKPSSSNLDEPVSSSVSQPARIQTKLEIQNEVRSQEESKKGHEQSKQLSQQPDQKKTIDQILETQLKNEEDIRNFNKMMNEPESVQLQKAFAKQMSKDEILEQMKQQYKNRKQAEVQDDDLALAVKNKQKQQQNSSQQLNNNSKSTGKKQAELEDMLKSFDDIEKPIDDLYDSPKQNSTSFNQVTNKSNTEDKVRQSFQINQPVKYEPQNSSKISSQIQSKNQSKVQFTETESEQQMKPEPKISHYAVKQEQKQENVVQKDKYGPDLYYGLQQSLEEQKGNQLNVNQQPMNSQIKSEKPAYDQKDAVIKQLNIRIAELEQKQALQSQNQNLDNILLKDAQNDQVKLIKLQYESYIKQLKMDITKLTQENAELCKIKLVEQSPQTDVLKRKIEISNQNFAEVQAENTKLSQQLENSIKELKAAKIELFKKIDDLTLQNAQLTETLNKLQDMNLKLQVENKTLTQQIQRSAPSNSKQENLLQQVKAENKTLIQQLQSKNDLIAQNDLLQEEIIQLQAQQLPQNESQKIIELTNKCSKLTQQIKLLQEENEQLNFSNKQTKYENEDTQKLLELTQRQQKIIQKLQQQAKQQNELITEAKGKNQIKSQCEIHYQIISDLEEQIIQKNARIRAIEHDLVEYQSDNRLEVVEERLRYKEQENDRLYKQVQELREINTELINDMENMCK